MALTQQLSDRKKSPLFRTLRKLQAFRAALLVVALELVSLQAMLIVKGDLWAGVFASLAGCVLAGVYVLLSPELYVFRWDEPPK